MSSRSLNSPRPALTLVELMVVIAIIAIIAGLAAVFMPGFELTERSGAGASNLQQWLMVARQRAAMDRKPHGLRLFRDDDPKVKSKKLPFMSRALYIQQPDDIVGGFATTDPNNRTQIILSGVDVTGGFADPALWPVQVGDSIQLRDGLMHRIVVIDPAKRQLTLASPMPADMDGGTFRIVRRPRPLGEETLLMPYDVAIDLNIYAPYSSKISTPPYNGDGTLDIMFAPEGGVMGNFGSDQLVFWIREKSDKADLFFGDPSLIVVFTRSGLVESYEIPRPITPVTKIDPFINIR